MCALPGWGTSLPEEKIEELRKDLPGWQVVEVDGVKRLQRRFDFPDFETAIRFTNQVGEMAEEVDHHSELVTTWGKVEVRWWTHIIQGLHKNDFIMAARTDRLFAGQ